MSEHEIKVGQLWRDLDKRVGNRRLRVVEVGDQKVTLSSCWAEKVKTKIRKDRLRHPFFALVSAPIGEQHEGEKA